MENIHYKSVDPISQNLLRLAAQKGIKLNWERYERLQPQDGFLRLGLSCPYGCMQGPCRIDPFGRGPDRGLCGLDRDGMVAAFLLRLSLHGTLETLSTKVPKNPISKKSWPPPLDGIATRALKNLGDKPLSLQEIYHSASLLQRPMESPDQLIQQALRLGILTILLMEQRKPSGKASKRLHSKVGYGLLSKSKVFIGVVGHPPSKLVSSLLKETSHKASPSVQLLSLGDWIPANGSFLPFACTSGEAELLLSSGNIHLLLAGPTADPSLLELCQILKLPIVTSKDPPKAKDILSLARQHFSTRSQERVVFDPSLVGEGQVTTSVIELKKVIEKSSFDKVALLGGSDTTQQPMGWLPVEVANALFGEDYLVASWGDAALWMIKNGLTSEKRDSAVTILDQKQGPLLALKALAAAGKLEHLKGVCFTGLKACQDLAMALGLASLGVKVCVAVPLPLWGSENVRNLLGEKLKAVNTTLTHFDHPVHVQEILEWFSK